MLTRLRIRNFKVFGEVNIELGQQVVFVGPNNSGKTSALQALALWSKCLAKWIEKRGESNTPKERPGVTINRRDLIALPVPSANLLWRDLHVREGSRENGRTRTRNVLIDIDVEGMNEGKMWRLALELDYANEEAFYCRPKVDEQGGRMEIPPAARSIQVAYLPPMSGLAANETRLDEGAIAVRIGEGRTAEVLRNLCWQAFQHKDKSVWDGLVKRMRALFGIELEEPGYIRERGEVVLGYNYRGSRLDLSASGRGQQQTLLLLAHMAANPGAVLLLDEPDAHLEVLRQRQIYQVLSSMAIETNSQIIAASHSEIILNEAAARDLVIAFVGYPHRIDNRVNQLYKALKEIGFEQYLQAEQTGWVLYLEGATDLAILQALARKLNHPASKFLESPFVHYVANQPNKAESHFHGLREAKPDLVGIAIYDRLERPLHSDDRLRQLAWQQREIENYFTNREALLAYAKDLGHLQLGELNFQPMVKAMNAAIDSITSALRVLGRPDVFGPDIKVTDDFLDPLFTLFFRSLNLPEGTMRKTDYHRLAEFVPPALISPEVTEKLDKIVAVAETAHPRTAADSR